MTSSSLRPILCLSGWQDQQASDIGPEALTEHFQLKSRPYWFTVCEFVGPWRRRLRGVEELRRVRRVVELRERWCLITIKKVEVSVVTASALIASGGAPAVARRQATLAGTRGSVQRLGVVV